MGERTIIALDTIGGGAASELFTRELRKVLENIDDPNADPDAPREITLKIRIHPLAGTDELKTAVICTSKLAGYRPVKGTAFMGRVDGQLVAVAFDPKQGQLFDNQDGAVVPMNRNREAAQ